MNFKKSVHSALWGSKSWEISAHPSDPSVIADGKENGRRLNETYPKFPLLFKVIDTKTRLSVQVHPNEETCKVTGGEPKTEMRCALSEFLALYTAKGEIDLDGKRVMVRTSVLIPPSSTCELFGSDSILFLTRFKEGNSRDTSGKVASPPGCCGGIGNVLANERKEKYGTELGQRFFDVSGYDGDDRWVGNRREKGKVENE